MTVTSTNQKVSFSGNGSTTVFAYNFKIFAQTDLLVILRSATGTETTQTLTTHYTVSGVGVTSGGNVTMGTAPPSGTTLVIQRVQPQLQGLDLVPNDPFPAQTMENALDKLVFNVQTLNEEVGRAIKASTTNTIGNTEFTVSATDRANKLFSFDSSGNLNIAQELGTYKGNWAASTTYAVRDLVKDTSTGNIFICITAHTSSGSQPLTTNTDAAKWSLIVDAASATTSATAAASSATAAASSATAGANSATAAASSATAAAGSSGASGAASSATAAGNSATAAASSATSAASSLSTFQSQYHGAASSDPTSNLSTGDLYFNTSNNTLRIYNGSAWVAAAFDTSGALVAANNLSDVASAATALGNLGVNSTAAELNQLDAIVRGSIIYGNASAATARLAKGASGTVLTAGASDISWATVSTGTPAVVFPSDWASATSTYTSSGTWAKGALDDDDFVWFYLVGGGGGGGAGLGANSRGALGGTALLLYGKASVFDGAAYVIGAAGAGTTGNPPSAPTVSTIQLSIKYATNTATGATAPSNAGGIGIPVSVHTGVNSAKSGTTIVTGFPSESYTFTNVTFPVTIDSTAWAAQGLGVTAVALAVKPLIFGGAHGFGYNEAGHWSGGGSSAAAVSSMFAGNGGQTEGAAGIAPGGGGAGKSAAGTGGAGAAGSLRVYAV